MDTQQITANVNECKNPKSIIDFEDVITKLPTRLTAWAMSLTEEDLARLLTIIGDANCQIVYKKAVDLRGSCKIGMSGEEEVRKMLSARKCILKNTAKKGKTGDFIVVVDGIRILIEVKKYSKTIPHEEIRKMYRDINNNGSVNGAICISLTSKIVGYGKKLTRTTFTTSGGAKITVVFITYATEELIDTALDIVVADHQRRLETFSMQSNMSNIIDDMFDNLDSLTNCRNVLDESRASVNKQITSATTSVISAEVNMRHGLNSLKKTIIREKKEEFKNITLCQSDDDSKQPSQLFDSMSVYYNLPQEKKNLLSLCVIKLGGQCPNIQVNDNTVKTADGKLTIKMSQSSVKFIFTSIKKGFSNIPGKWSYSNSLLTVDLNNDNFKTIIGFIQDSIQTQSKFKHVEKDKKLQQEQKK